jgi:excisionase family DNA binding protein
VRALPKFERRFLSVEETSALLSISEATVRRLANQKKLPSIRLPSSSKNGRKSLRIDRRRMYRALGVTDE